jgi:hypothetical protein
MFFMGLSLAPANESGKSKKQVFEPLGLFKTHVLRNWLAELG